MDTSFNTQSNDITWRHTENNMIKDKNNENVPHLEITEVVLVHCHIVNNDYHMIQVSCIQLLPVYNLVNY